jgi:phosphate transport system protein
MKRFFDDELNTIRSHLSLMGEKAIEQLRTAIKALIERDREAAERVRRNDDILDELEVKIDEEAIRFVGLRGPVARDLRLVVVGMKAGHDLERVGDEANNIAKRALKLVDEQPVKEYVDIPRMAAMAEEMLRDALSAFFDGDEAKAIDVCQRDGEVDKINKQLYRELVGCISERPSTTTAAIELMFVSKSLERIADHATNIAEEVIYLLRGKDVRHTKEVSPD